MKLILVIMGICLTFSSWAVDEIVVQALFKNKALVTIDGKRRVLKQGKASPEGVILISTTSKTARLDVDGEQKDYGLNRVIANSYHKAKYQEAHIWGRSQGNQMVYLTQGKINGGSIKFLVDTGASSVALNENDAKSLGLLYRFAPKIMVSTASGMAPAYEISLKTVQVGEIIVRDVKAFVITGSSPATALLGMTFLSRLSMETKGKHMILRKKY